MEEPNPYSPPKSNTYDHTHSLKRHTLQIAARKTPASSKLKLLIDQLRRPAVACEDLRAGILEDPCSKAKDLSSSAVRSYCQLSKARAINYKEVVHLWGERGMIDNKKAARAAAGEEKKGRELQKKPSQRGGKLKLSA